MFSCYCFPFLTGPLRRRGGPSKPATSNEIFSIIRLNVKQKFIHSHGNSLLLTLSVCNLFMILVKDTVVLFISDFWLLLINEFLKLPGSDVYITLYKEGNYFYQV